MARSKIKGPVGLALGGGAVRGIAHIGVLKALEERNVEIGMIAGTSVGSLIGALYCGGLGWKEIWDRVREMSWGDLVQINWSGMGLAKTKRMEDVLVELLGDIDFGDLRIPLRAVAVDITSAEEVVIESGSVAQAVRASASIPAIFAPVESEGRLLVDGGVANNLPVDVARDMGARTVIAVDLNPEAAEPRRPANLLDIMYRTFAILMWNTSSLGREEADILIQPKIGEFSFHDFSQAEKLFELGEEAANRALD
jgi:NTE family protein